MGCGGQDDCGDGVAATDVRFEAARDGMLVPRSRASGALEVNDVLGVHGGDGK
jgi:hypothetical protein